MSRHRDGNGNSVPMQNDRPLVATGRASEVLRAGGSCEEGPAELRKPEERVSVAWRVFGGTLLSMAALVIVTVIQQFASTLSELRAELNHLNEVQAELLKKEEFTNRTNTLWTTLRDVTTDLPVIKTRAAATENDVKAAQQENKELARDIQQLRERLATLEGRQGTIPGRAATGSTGAESSTGPMAD